MSDLFQNHAAKSGPVECLGQIFPSDEARREHYLKLLAEKLKDLAFRKIEGFPIGSDEDILALSDPPYYTACRILLSRISSGTTASPTIRQFRTAKNPLRRMLAKANMTRYINSIHITPKSRIEQSCATSCSTPSQVI